MKILHINCNYLSTPLHQTMLNHLDKHSVDSVVFTPISKYTVKRIEPNPNVTAVKCFNKFDRFIFHLKQRKIRKALTNNIDVKDIDCIHAYTLFTDGYCAFRLKQKFNIPYIVAVRDTDVNMFLKKLFYLRKTGLKILEKASYVIFLSETYKEHVLLKYVPKKCRKEIEKKTLIIPNGIDDFWLKNAYKDKDISKTKAQLNNRILNTIFIGVINSRKNPSTSVKAFEILKERGWEVNFTVIGDVEDSKEYAKVIEFDRTKYYPSMGKSRLIDFYRSNAIFVMPSRTETFGLTYAEAISQGLPVIYSIGQGFDGQFPDGEIGYGVDAESPLDIADKIEMIANDYVRISDNCLSVYNSYDWNSITEKYKELYYSVK